MTRTASMRQSTWTVALERTEFISDRSFDDILAGIHRGLGHPHFGEFIRRIGAINDWQEYRTAVEAEAGPSGLMVFLELDIGSVIGRDPEAVGYRVVRIIAGNPVTMESMTRTTPAAAAFAPVTILLFEFDDGVHVRYDSVASAVGTELTQPAAIVATRLDSAVLALIAASI